MLKKILFLMFFLISIACFAKTFDFIVVDEDGEKIENASVSVNGEKKLTDTSGKVSFKVDDDNVKVEVEKEAYLNSRFSLDEKGRKEREFTVTLKKIALSLVSFNFNVADGTVKYRKLGKELFDEIPFSKNFLKLSVPEGRYDFVFQSKNHIEKKLLLVIDKSFSTFNIKLEKKTDRFFIMTNRSKYPSIYFLDEFSKSYSTVENCKITFSRAGLPIKEIDFKKNFELADLDYGIYDIKAESSGYEPFVANGVVIDESVNNFILINLKPMITYITGVTSFKDNLIGGVDISFVDVENNIYKFKSDLSGKFLATLPPKKYKLHVEKPGYVFIGDMEKTYDFSNKEEFYTLDIDLEETPSIVRGTVTDRNGVPVQGAKIVIRVDDTENNFITDSDGSFSGEVSYGIALIKIEKTGFRPFGTIKKVEKFSTLNNLNFSLNPYLSSLSGFLTDGVKPLKNIKLFLYSEDEHLVASSVSGENGYYEFPDLNILKSYYVRVEDENYFPYFSKKFVLGKENLENFNLILNSSNLKFILELTGASGEIISNELVRVNGQKFITDINGIVIDELKNFSEKENIRVEVPKYDFKKIFKFHLEQKRPFKINVVID